MAGSSLCKLQGDITSLEDQISELPDAIHVDVMSLLTLKEAGRSSLLSSRWRNLWKYTSHLNFDQPLDDSITVKQFREMKKDWQTKYMTWVNSVMGSHERHSLEEFRVRFGLGATFSKDIDEWVKFIISKRVKRIEIDFTQYAGTDFYSISQECNDLFKSVSNLSNIMCLKSLTLGKVNVDGELIEYLLSKCPYLEMVSISWSLNIFRLKVAGPCLPLKYLKILRCDSLESIELCAPSLVTFFYLGKPIKFVVGRNPLLSELYMQGGYDENVVSSCLPLFSSHFSQIETLSLASSFKDNLELPDISGLRNVKHIVWRISSCYDRSLIGVAKFIMAAPCLQKLTLRLTVGFPLHSSPLEEHTIQFHEGIKEIEICEYVGCRSQLELARYLVRSAVNLEKMVIDTSCLGETKKRKQKATKLAEKQAEELRESLSPRAELIIL